MRILHFADAHIDIASQRKRDPESGMPIRVLDFLKALDAIIDTAIDEKVDLVLFAGDAYKDRTPVPTYQREWGRRIMRLSQAGIPTLLLVGNHDLPPTTNRANALQEFDTLAVPHVTVLSKPRFLKPADLDGLPLQIIAIPWISRSGMMATLAARGETNIDAFEELGKYLHAIVTEWMSTADPEYPLILTAHGMVEGAVLGSERTISLGSDLTFPGALIRDPRLAYSALGHVHKFQDLNAGKQPPVVYPGSIERVDFGEVQDDKGFVIVTVEKNQPTLVERRVLNGRKFIDRYVRLETPKDVASKTGAVMPSPDEMDGAIFRLTMDYPRELEPLIDEASIREAAKSTLEFHLVRKVRMEARSRVADGVGLSQMPLPEQLEIYWKATKIEREDREILDGLARSIFAKVDGLNDGQA